MNPEAPRQSDAPPVIVEASERIAVIRFNRPAERNALSIVTLEALDAELSALIQRADIAAIIFTGTDGLFASGADIGELALLTPTTAREFARRGQHIFQKIDGAAQLTIAAISGYCMGGALDLALACNVRVASPGAVFAHPGARLGTITGWGGTQRLARRIGAARALEMFTTAKRVRGEEAFEMGLVDSISDDRVRPRHRNRDARATRAGHFLRKRAIPCWQSSVMRAMVLTSTPD